jgi:hypothetical protein
MTVLHIVPIVCSTISIWFAFDQWFFLRIFLKKDIEPHAHHFLTSYWKSFVDSGVPIVLVGVAGTAASTAVVLSTDTDGVLRDKGSYHWYMASAIFAVGHLSFAAKILPVIRDLQNDGLTPALRRWLRVHNTRALTVDLACWVSCMVASAKTLSP